MSVKTKTFSVDRTPKTKSSKDSKAAKPTEKKHKSEKEKTKTPKADEPTKAKLKGKNKEAYSLFKNDQAKILELINNNENDNASVASQKQALKMTLELISIAEDRYRADPRQGNAYALSNFISQMRELISDLQASTDKSVVIDRILFDILQPTIMALASFIIEANFQLKKDIEPMLKSENKKKANDKIDKSSKATASYIKETFVQIQSRIEKVLQES